MMENCPSNQVQQNCEHFETEILRACWSNVLNERFIRFHKSKDCDMNSKIRLSQLELYVEIFFKKIQKNWM